MKFGQRLIIFSIVFCAASIVARDGRAQAIQMFLDPVAEPMCRVPLEIEVLILDNNGRVDTSIEGEKELQINVEENEGKKDKSFSIRSAQVSFRQGIGSFVIENDEEELLIVNVAMPDLAVSENINLVFRDEDVSPPEVVRINSDEPGIIRLEFNEALEEESAQETRNYKAITNRQEVYPRKIEYHGDQVVLEFEDYFDNDEEGYIELQDIEDLHGNPVPSGLKSQNFKGKCPCPTRF